MFKNKAMNVMIIVLLTLTLLGVVALILINYLTASTNASGEPTIDEIVAHSYETPELTTMLLDQDYVKVRFKIHVDNKKALAEITKRDFQIEHIIIHELASTESTELSGSEGITSLEKDLKQKLNELMIEGSVIKVYTTRLIIQ